MVVVSFLSADIYDIIIYLYYQKTEFMLLHINELINIKQDEFIDNYTLTYMLKYNIFLTNKF